jgi:surface protein
MAFSIVQLHSMDVTGMESMFEDAQSINGDISGWDVSSVNYTYDMFKGAIVFNGDISGWDVCSITDIESMFDDAQSFKGDISGWDVSSVDHMDYMFYGALAFNQDLCAWKSVIPNIANFWIFQNSGCKFTSTPSLASVRIVAFRCILFGVFGASSRLFEGFFHFSKLLVGDGVQESACNTVKR